MLFDILNINQSLSKDMTCTQRLRYLELPSLWHRRLRGDMMQICKMGIGINDMNCKVFFN